MFLRPQLFAGINNHIPAELAEMTNLVDDTQPYYSPRYASSYNLVLLGGQWSTKQLS